MSLPTILTMGDDIFEEPVSTSGAEQVRSCDEHTGRRNLTARIRNKDGHSFARECLGPDAFGTVGWMRD